MKKDEKQPSKSSLHFGVLGLVGEPNAGKSSLLNLLVGDELAIVSSAPQTTRKRVEGLITWNHLQLVILDSPGLVAAKKGLFQYLYQEALSVMAESDVVWALLPLDAEKPDAIQATLKWVANNPKLNRIVITKVDRVKFRGRLAKIHKMIEDAGLKDRVPVSELSLHWGKRDLETLKAELLTALLPKLHQVQEFPYDKDQLALSLQREIVEEKIRQELFRQLREEIPFGMAVHVRKMEEEAKITKIYADLWVNKEGHKPIVVGKKGQQIKSLGTQSRLNLEKWLQTRVHLELQVVVKENWALQVHHMKELGYVERI